MNNKVLLKEDENQVAVETKKELIRLNQALLYSELEDIDLVVPFDRISVGEKMKPYYDPMDSVYS